MDADEDRIFGGVRDPGPQFQRHEDVAVAGHFHFNPFGFEERLDIAGDVEGEILLAPVTAGRALVVAAVAGVEHDSLELPEIRDHLRAQLRLERLREIDSRDEVLAVLFRDREAEPAAHAVDHHFTAVELELEGIRAVVDANTLFDRRAAGREAVELRNVIDCEVFAPADFDDLPIGSRRHTTRESEKCQDGEEDFPPTEHGGDYGVGRACRQRKSWLSVKTQRQTRPTESLAP